MNYSPFDVTNSYDLSIHVHRWVPADPVRAVVQVAHGMQEHGKRYQNLAEALAPHKIAVYANDHRGHGASLVAPDKPGVLGPDGRFGVLGDLLQLNQMIHDAHDTAPVFLLGHSWGSFLTQRFIQEHGDQLAGAILSGSNGSNHLVGIGAYLGRLVTAIRGEERTAGLLELLSTGGLNKQFEPGETGYEWLSRDPETVKNYVNDPQCGVDFPNVFFREMVLLLSEAWKSSNEKKIAKELPVYIFSGGQDPVGLNGKGVMALVNRYRKLGLKDLEYHVYPGGRHEMLNETNRQEAIGHLIDWLNQRIPD